MSRSTHAKWLGLMLASAPGWVTPAEDASERMLDTIFSGTATEVRATPSTSSELNAAQEKLAEMEKRLAEIEARLGSTTRRPMQANSIERRLDDMERRLTEIERRLNLMQQWEPRIRRLETQMRQRK